MRKILMAAILIAGASGAQAADMPDYALRGGYSAGPTRAMWDGFYIGGQAAQAWASTSPTGGYNAGVINTYQQTTGLNGFGFPSLAHGSGDKSAFGGFAGYNVQFEDVVVGVEANYLHSGVVANSNNTLNAYTNGVLTATTQSNLGVTVKDFGSLRLRGGYMIGNFLPYAFVGVAAANVDIVQRAGVSYTSPTVPLPPFAVSTQPDRFVYGYAAGVGFDVMLIGGLFARAEYEYARYTARVDTSINTVKVGLGYKF